MSTPMLGRNLRILRKRHGYTIKEVAELLSIPQTSYRDLEYSSASKYLAQCLPILANRFGVSVSELLGRDIPDCVLDDCEQIREIADRISSRYRT